MCERGKKRREQRRIEKGSRGYAKRERERERNMEKHEEYKR